jgi:Tfp pilus assembly protein PilF
MRWRRAAASRLRISAASLIDQLVMAYGINGDLKKARALLDVAIQRDPDYF